MAVQRGPLLIIAANAQHAPARATPHLHQNWAHPCHICTGTGRTPATAAPALGSLPHIYRDWATPATCNCTSHCLRDAEPPTMPRCRLPRAQPRTHARTRIRIRTHTKPRTRTARASAARTAKAAKRPTNASVRCRRRTVPENRPLRSDRAQGFGASYARMRLLPRRCRLAHRRPRPPQGAVQVSPGRHRLVATCHTMARAVAAGRTAGTCSPGARAAMPAAATRFGRSGERHHSWDVLLTGSYSVLQRGATCRKQKQ
jgi:hypothetical protein